jgi:hypothetical protein
MRHDAAIDFERLSPSNNLRHASEILTEQKARFKPVIELGSAALRPLAAYPLRAGTLDCPRHFRPTIVSMLHVLVDREVVIRGLNLRAISAYHSDIGATRGDLADR